MNRRTFFGLLTACVAGFFAVKKAVAGRMPLNLEKQYHALWDNAELYTSGIDRTGLFFLTQCGSESSKLYPEPGMRFAAVYKPDQKLKYVLTKFEDLQPDDTFCLYNPDGSLVETIWRKTSSLPKPDPRYVTGNWEVIANGIRKESFPQFISYHQHVLQFRG